MEKNNLLNYRRDGRGWGGSSLLKKGTKFKVCDFAIYLHLIGNFYKLAHYDLEKLEPVFKERGSIPVSLTPSVSRVDLLHTERFVQSFNEPIVYSICTVVLEYCFFQHSSPFTYMLLQLRSRKINTVKACSSYSTRVMGHPVRITWWGCEYFPKC